MHDFELAVRSVEEILPQMPTNRLHKWKGILTTALLKVDAELQRTHEHTCGVCLFREYGYRLELPVGWREKGDLVICFNHEDNEIADALQKSLDADKEYQDATAEQSLEELMDLV